MAAERVPEPLNINERGGVVDEHLSTAITLVPLMQCQHFYDFLKAYKETFQIMCLNPTLIFVGALICHFSALDHGQ